MKTKDKGNKLIAEFMEFHEIMLDEQSKYDIQDVYEILGIDITAMGTIEETALEFHSSWDWLMPVVEKVYEYAELGNEQRQNIEESLIGIIDISDTWSAVLSWIEWYYENEKS